MLVLKLIAFLLALFAILLFLNLQISMSFILVFASIGLYFVANLINQEFKKLEVSGKGRRMNNHALKNEQDSYIDINIDDQRLPE